MNELLLGYLLIALFTFGIIHWGMVSDHEFADILSEAEECFPRWAIPMIMYSLAVIGALLWPPIVICGLIEYGVKK